MPFIDSKITLKLTVKQKEELKTELGKAISLLNKTESYLMVGISDGYDLFLAGNKLERGAFISVQVFGDINPSQSNKMTAEICNMVSEKLNIPSDNVYVTYQGIHNWGWNGGNF